MGKRIEYLDIAKAICIILVVVGHYCPDNSPFWYVKLHDVIYTFHMPLFMFASGFVYMATKKSVSYGEFIERKFKRLMIPYFSTSFLVITIKLLTQGAAYVENPVTFMSYLRVFYYPEAGFFLWFIWALWWMFMIIPLFSTLRSRLALFALAIIAHYVPFTISEIFCFTQFKNMLIFFMLGVLSFEIKTLHEWISRFSTIRLLLVCSLFLALETACVVSENVIGGGNNSLLRITLPYIGILCVIEVSKCISLYSKLIRGKELLLTVSSSSYIVYLFHTTFEGFAKAFCFKLPLDQGNVLVFSLEALFIIVIGVLIPVLLHRLIFQRFAITRTLFGL